MLQVNVMPKIIDTIIKDIKNYFRLKKKIK